MFNSKRKIFAWRKTNSICKSYKSKNRRRISYFSQPCNRLKSTARSSWKLSSSKTLTLRISKGVLRKINFTWLLWRVSWMKLRMSTLRRQLICLGLKDPIRMDRHLEDLNLIEAPTTHLLGTIQETNFSKIQLQLLKGSTRWWSKLFNIVSRSNRGKLINNGLLNKSPS